VFDLKINQKTSVNSIDIVQLGGGLKDRAVKVEAAVVVNDGNLVIQLLSTNPKKGDPLIAALHANRTRSRFTFRDAGSREFSIV
jgi:Malectin domain